MESNLTQPLQAEPIESRPSLELLSVRGICKSFQSGFVLEDVSLSIREGEVLGLIGPNGAGKTTLFECLAGLIPIDSGEILFQGQSISDSGAARKDVLFYVPDAIRPWSDQTVSWVVSFFESMYSRQSSDSAALLSSLKLDRLLKRRIWMLSKGESKRLLLLIGLLTPQSILLVDEPFDGLDLRQTKEVMALLRTHAARGRTLFVSIHQLTDAARVCDRLVLLSGGRVVGEGTLDELLTKSGVDTKGMLGDGLEEVFLALT